MSHLYPLFLDVSERSILIVGGGAVAARKAAGLLAAGATTIRAVAPKFVREFPASIEKIVGNFDPGQMEGAGLVFAATDSGAVNDAVVAEARRRGILVNRADVDEEDPGDFVTPALLRSGAITVAVSAAGSPALAAGLRDALAGAITDDWVKLAEALKSIRPRIKGAGIPINRRREIFKALATGEAAEAMASGGMTGLHVWVRGKFPELASVNLGESV